MKCCTTAIAALLGLLKVSPDQGGEVMVRVDEEGS